MGVNEPRDNQRLAVAAASVAYTVALTVAAWLTYHQTRLLGREEQWRTDRWNELYAAGGLYVALIAVLVWLGLAHRPTHGRPSRPFPPGSVLVTLGVLAVVEWNTGDYLTTLSALLLGGMVAATAWTLVLVSSRPRAGTADRPGERVPTDPRAVAAPAVLVVRPRTRWWWFWGWMVGAAFWGGMGAVLRTGPYPEEKGLLIGFAVACACCGVAALGLRLRFTADRAGVHMYDLFRTKHVAWCDVTDVELRPEGNEYGDERDAWHLVISTTESPLVSPEGVDAGTAETGGPLDALRAQLLAMRATHLPPG